MALNLLNQPTNHGAEHELVPFIEAVSNPLTHGNQVAAILGRAKTLTFRRWHTFASVGHGVASFVASFIANPVRRSPRPGSPAT